MNGALTYIICMYVNMVSKEAVIPQECSQPSLISGQIVFRAKNWNILFTDFPMYFSECPLYILLQKLPLKLIFI